MGFSKLFVVGSDAPRLSAASIIKIELPNEDEPFIPFAATMGAVFLHGSAVTIHKAQGSQWENVLSFWARYLRGSPDQQDGVRFATLEKASICCNNACPGKTLLDYP